MSSGKSKWQDRMPKWSVTPTAKQKRDYFGSALVKDYTNLFNRKVKRQNNYAELTLHIIIGQLPSVKKMRIYFGDNTLDLRISGCFFKPSGSGGGRGLNFTAKICRGIDVLLQMVTEITDAALIGSADEIKIYDPEKKGYVFRERLKRGALDPTIVENEDRRIVNIVTMNEADILFSGVMTEHKKNAMLYYQIALNTMGTEDNKLGKKLLNGDWIEFNPDCSLFLISYPPDSFYETIVKRGFLQRMLILYNTFSTEDRIEVARELTSSLGEERSPEAQYDNLISRLSFVNEFWSGKSDVKIKIDPKAQKVLNRMVDEIFVQFDGIAEFPRKKLEEFTQRWIEHTWRLAWHHMILRLDTTLRLEDVGYARGYILPIWKDLIGLLEEGIEAPRDHDKGRKTQLTEAIRLYQATTKKSKLKPTEPIPRAQFIRDLAHSDYWGVSTKTATGRVRRMEDEGWFERSYKGTAPLIKLKKLPKHLKKRDE